MFERGELGKFMEMPIKAGLSTYIGSVIDRLPSEIYSHEVMSRQIWVGMECLVISFLENKLILLWFMHPFQNCSPECEKRGCQVLVGSLYSNKPKNKVPNATFLFQLWTATGKFLTVVSKRLFSYVYFKYNAFAGYPGQDHGIFEKLRNNLSIWRSAHNY